MKESCLTPKIPKNKAAQQLGRKGGKARAARLSASARSQIAKDAAAARWKDHVKKAKP